MCRFIHVSSTRCRGFKVSLGLRYGQVSCARVAGYSSLSPCYLARKGSRRGWLPLGRTLTNDPSKGKANGQSSTPMMKR